MLFLMFYLLKRIKREENIQYIVKKISTQGISYIIYHSRTVTDFWDTEHKLLQLIKKKKPLRLLPN